MKTDNPNGITGWDGCCVSDTVASHYTMGKKVHVDDVAKCSNCHNKTINVRSWGMVLPDNGKTPSSTEVVESPCDHKGRKFEDQVVPKKTPIHFPHSIICLVECPKLNNDDENGALPHRNTHQSDFGCPGNQGSPVVCGSTVTGAHSDNDITHDCGHCHPSGSMVCFDDPFHWLGLFEAAKMNCEGRLTTDHMARRLCIGEQHTLDEVPYHHTHKNGQRQEVGCDQGYAGVGSGNHAVTVETVRNQGDVSHSYSDNCTPKGTEPHHCHNHLGPVLPFDQFELRELIGHIENEEERIHENGTPHQVTSCLGCRKLPGTVLYDCGVGPVMGGRKIQVSDYHWACVGPLVEQIPRPQ